MWPDNHDFTDDPVYQNCCWRETVADAERCLWHTDSDAIEKTAEALKVTYVDEGLGRNTTPFRELLDGADLSKLELEDMLSFRFVSLRDADFSCTNFCGADFSRSLISEADLSDATLSDTDFEFANLTNADLSGAVLNRANLSPTFLDEAILNKANLQDANLSGARLTGSSLQNAILADADLSNLKDSDDRIWETDLSGTDLSGANLSGADLSGADLSDVDLSGADLSDTDLSGVDLSGATIEETKLVGASVIGATLTDTKLSGADLTDATLREVDFARASMIDVSFDGAEINSCNFNQATVSDIDLRNVNSLKNADFTRSVISDVKMGNGQISKAPNATFSEVNFSQTDFSDGVFTGASFEDFGTFNSVDLSGAQFDNAEFGYGLVSHTDSIDISGTSFEDSVFNGDISNVEGQANFQKANLSGCAIWNSDVSGSGFHASTAVGAEFFDTDFSDVEFHGVDFTGALFSDDCTFDGASFRRAVLAHADLSGCNLEQTNFLGADLTGSKCSETDFSESRLVNADLSTAFLSDADLSETLLGNADFGGDYLFSIDLAPEDMDLIFVCSEQGRHKYVGATLPDDAQIDINEIDAVVRHTDTDPSVLGGNSYEDLIFLGSDADDIHSDNFEINEVAPENRIGAFADFSDGSKAAEIDSLILHAQVDNFTLDEVNSDLVFISFSDSAIEEYDHAVNDSPTSDIEINICGVNLTELEIYDINPEAHNNLKDRSDSYQGAPHPVDMFNWSPTTGATDVLHLVDADFVNSNCSDIAPAYTVGSRATLDSAIAAYSGDKNADFSHSYFSNSEIVNASLQDVNFKRADLSEANFTDTDLEDAAFAGANLSETSFIAADCEGCGFEETVLTRASLENADLVRANLTGSYLFGTQLDGARISSQTKLVESGPIGDASVDDRCRYDTDVPPDGPVQSIVMDKNELATKNESPRVIQFRRARSSYRRLEELARQNGFPALQGTMFKRRQEMRRKFLREQNRRTKWLFAEIQRWLFVYGESFSRILGISIGIVTLFWLLFLTTGTVQTVDDEIVTLNTLIGDPVLVWETLYHSILLFFTGTGPLEPTGVIGQAFTAVESITGPIFLALLVFVLGRRAAR